MMNNSFKWKRSSLCRAITPEERNVMLFKLRYACRATSKYVYPCSIKLQESFNLSFLKVIYYMFCNSSTSCLYFDNAYNISHCFRSRTHHWGCVTPTLFTLQQFSPQFSPTVLTSKKQFLDLYFAVIKRKKAQEYFLSFLLENDVILLSRFIQNTILSTVLASTEYNKLTFYYSFYSVFGWELLKITHRVHFTHT